MLFVLINVSRPRRSRGYSSILAQNGINLLTHQHLKLGRNARLDLLELRGELGPDFLLCGETFGAGDEL